MTCTFFGQARCVKAVRHLLRDVIITTIKHYKVDTFYIGRRGRFNRLVRKTLKELENDYDINYYVITNLNLFKKHSLHTLPISEIFPEKVKFLSPKFADDFSSFWMINKSDIIITSVISPKGDAERYKNVATERGKLVINIL